MVKIIAFIRPFILFFILPLAVSGCLKNDWEEKEQHEKDLIKSYIASNGITEEQKTEGGIYYVEEIAGTGLTPVVDDYVIINYTGRYLEDNSIHETSYDSLKDEWEYADTYTYYVYGPLKFKYGYSISGVNEGLGMMKEGGKAKLVIPSDKAFYDFNPMVYDIELLKVIKDPVAYEDSVLKAYLEVKGFDTLTTAYKGIYFKETLTPDPADQRTVQTGDTVFFRFSGKLIDGFASEIKDDRVFDTNADDDDPIKLYYGTQLKVITGVILAIPEGLKTALDTMRVGTHATAVLPYTQAFKDAGLVNSIYGYTIVPKYQTIVYDIIVEDIRSMK
jgi:FKBP-type peptidyl-prolyl cis-trans isomerase